MLVSPGKNVSAALGAHTLRIGFIPLNDAAPIIVAQEHGFFRRHGLRTTLSREVGWATVRDKIIFRELDASHALGAMVISTTLGLDCTPCECVTACVLNVDGNAITLSRELWNRGVRDAATMRDEIRRARPERVYVFGVVFGYSSHRIHLCDWLRQAGVNPDREVRIVVVPPPQLFRNLAAGTIDGYCVGDPWNSLAVREKVGWCPTSSLELSHGHPEKVLMVRRDFAEGRHPEHLAMVAAIRDAAALCDDPAFRPELVRLLSRREYLNVPERVIAAGIVGPFDTGRDQPAGRARLITFSHGEASDPSASKAAWLIQGLKRHGLFPASVAIPTDLGARTFRSDLFHQASTLHSHEPALATN